MSVYLTGVWRWGEDTDTALVAKEGHSEATAHPKFLRQAGLVPAAGGQLL